MKTGRPPKPTALRLIEGNPGKRKLPKEVEPSRGAIPDPPDDLKGPARDEWLRISPELYHLGLLTNADLQPLAAYCMAYGRWITAERAIARMAEKDPLTGGLMIKTIQGNAIQNPLVGTSNKAASDMVRYATEFGLTPVARTRLAIDASAQQKSKFEGLFA